METTQNLQQIPLKQIRVSDNNPRKIIKSGAVEVLAASMKRVGQETPVKVRPLSAAVEKCESVNVQSSSDSSVSPLPQGSDIQASQSSVDSDYELIGGHMRLEAAKSLGWESLNALVLEVTPDQAELAAFLDNQGENMHWLDRYQAIEKRILTHPDLSQQEIGDELGISQQLVSHAQKLLEVLNIASRDLIYHSMVKMDSDYEFTVNIALRLYGLGDPQKVETALKVVLEHKMTEPEAAKLVAWIKAGNDPLTFGRGGNGEKETGDGDANDPNAQLWQGLPKGIKIRQTAQGYELRWKLSPAEAPAVVYGAMSTFEKLKQEAADGAADEKYETALPKLLNDAVAVKNAEKTHTALLETARREGEERAKALKDAEKAKKKQLDKMGAHIQRKINAHEDRETLKGEIKAKLDATFGAGMFTESLWQTCLDGQKTQAIKTAASVLGKSPLLPQEQEAFLADFKKSLSRLYRLHQVATAPTPAPQSPMGVMGSPIGSQMGSSSPPAEAPHPEEEPKDDVAHPQGPSPIPNMQAIMEQVDNAVKCHLQVNAPGIVDSLVKDGKQAINYEIRKGMRNVLKDLL